MFDLKDIAGSIRGRLVKKGALESFKSVSTDSRKIRTGALFFALKGERFNGHDFAKKAYQNGAKGLVLESEYLRNNPGVADMFKGASVFAVKDSLTALGDLACFHRGRFNIPIIGVTGSSGKTTAKEMISAVLETSFQVLKTPGSHNNFIGVPLALLELKQNHELACLEMGTNHWGEIHRLARIARPTIGVITNISESHLEAFKTVKGVLKEKRKILELLSMPRIGVINADDKLLKNLRQARVKLLSFGINNHCDFQAVGITSGNDCVSFYLKGKKFSINNPGVHNIYNALAAIACATILGIDLETVKEALSKVKFAPSRFNLLKKKNLRIIDDTYNANPLSCESALASLANLKTKGKRIAVFADMLELGKRSELLHKRLGKIILRSGVDVLFTLGESGKAISDSAKKTGFKGEIFHASNQDKLREKLFSVVRNNDIVLIKGSRKMRMERLVRALLKRV